MIHGESEAGSDALLAFVRGLRAGEAMSHANLTLLPLFGAPSGPALVTLDEALRAGSVEVREIGDHGSVPAEQPRGAGRRPRGLPGERRR